MMSGLSGTHHAVAHDLAHLGGLEVAAHQHAAVQHLVLGHELDQAGDDLPRLALAAVNLLQVQRVGVGVLADLRSKEITTGKSQADGYER